MIRKFAFGIAGLMWFGLVFVISLWMTFPSGAAATRVMWEVQEQSKGALALSLGSVSPWWTGVRMSEVALGSVDVNKREGSEDAVKTVFAAKEARVRVGMLSLITGEPYLVGQVVYGDSYVDVDATLRTNDRGTMTLGDLAIRADDFPIASLPPMGGVTLDGSGAFDLNVNLDAREGMRKANGKASIRGENIEIAKLIAPDVPMLSAFDMVTLIEEIDIRFDITEGRAKIKSGRIVSNLVSVTLTGEVILREDLMGTKLRMKARLELGEDLVMFKSFLKDALHKDGSHHYRLNGTVAKPRFSPDREQRDRRGRNNKNTKKPAANDGDSAPAAKKRPASDRIKKSRGRRNVGVDDRGLRGRNNDRAVPRAPLTIGREFADDDDEFDDDDEGDGDDGDDTDGDFE